MGSEMCIRDREGYIELLSNAPVESDVDGPDAAARVDHESQLID